MSGRRMRKVAGKVMEELGLDAKLVVSGLTNEYIHYVATYEEYQVRIIIAFLWWDIYCIVGHFCLDIFLLLEID